MSSRPPLFCVLLVLAGCRANAGSEALSSRESSAPSARTSTAEPTASASTTRAPTGSSAKEDSPHNQRVVSHNGNIVAVTTYDDQTKRSRLVLETKDGSLLKVLVDMSSFTVTNPPELERRATEILLPRFSPDDRRVYFLADAWGTEHALYFVDVTTAEVRYLVNTNSLAVIDDCEKPELVGRIVVRPHHGKDALNFHGVDPLDWYFLLEPSGRTVGVIGDYAKFMNEHCRVSRDAGDEVALQLRPPQFAQFQCGDRLIRAYTVHLIDGGSWTEYSSFDATIKIFAPDWAAAEHIKKHCPRQKAK